MTRYNLLLIGVILTACASSPTGAPPTFVFVIPSPLPMIPEFIAPSATFDPNGTPRNGSAAQPPTAEPTVPVPPGSEAAASAFPPPATSVPSVVSERAARLARLAGVENWLYQLQDVNLGQVASSNFDLVVTDYSRDGTPEGQWSAGEVARMKQGGRLVIAYVSIGEAEDYRFYWNSAWDDQPRDGIPDPDAPLWLEAANSEWCNLPDSCNYKVRFWDPDWQKIIMGSPASYVDRIMASGFDGIYLDIVDAYEYFQETEGRAQAAQEMIDFVTALAHYTRVTKGSPGFFVFPQNAEGLAEYPNYAQVIDGIGKESTYYALDEHQPTDAVDYSVQMLNIIRDSGGIVLSVDYVSTAQNIADYYTRARAEGYVPYATVRDLDRMTINAGFEP